MDDVSKRTWVSSNRYRFLRWKMYLTVTILIMLKTSAIPSIYSTTVSHLDLRDWTNSLWSIAVITSFFRFFKFTLFHSVLSNVFMISEASSLNIECFSIMKEVHKYSLFILATLCTPSWSETNKHTSFFSNFEKRRYNFFVQLP